MSEFTTYSFADVSLVISHPKVGSCTLTGKGLGSVSVARANDMTQHDIAADGSTMVSKVVTKNGTMGINLQQTSTGHKWLKKWLAYCVGAPTNEWAQTKATLKFPAYGEQIDMNGISPQKRPDAAYQAAGQQVNWNLMVAEISG